MDPQTRQGQKVVLVVDDERDITGAVQGYLLAVLPTVKVHTAHDGTSALAVLDAGHVDLLLTDYRMPGMNGVELMRAARLRQPDLDCMLMTAYPDTSLAVRALNEERIRAFLTKPIEPEQLHALVAEFLGLSR